MAPRPSRAALLAAASLCGNGGMALAESLRELLLRASYERINTWYANKTNLADAYQLDGVTYVLSREDKECGGEGVPLTFTEFDVADARPVDVFNVLAEATRQPEWDPTCLEMRPLGDMPLRQARAFAGTFGLKALSIGSRLAAEWQLAAANFSREEFWVVYSTANNEELRQRTTLGPHTVEMQTCLASIKINRTAAGRAHVIMASQANGHTWPLSARAAVKAAWRVAVDLAKGQRRAAQAQARLGWNETRTSFPPWMLEGEQCAAPAADTELKDSLLQRARSEFAVARPGQPREAALPGGAGKIRLWRRMKACGGCGGPPRKVPALQAEFSVPGSSPEELFNLLLNKRDEHRWNSRLVRANITGFRGGARAVHEELRSPRRILRRWKPREIWEWQCANHSLKNRSYLISLASISQPSTKPFEAGSVCASRCLGAFQLSPLPLGANGTLVRMSDHLDPNVGVLPAVAFLWESQSERLLEEFAAALIAEAKSLPARRKQNQSHYLAIEGGALALLAPQPGGRNASASVADVLSLRGSGFLQAFALLDVPAALDSSAWAWGEFRGRAADVLRLYRRVARNASVEENGTFRMGAAADVVQLQLQGEALAGLQRRVLEELARLDCNASLPDIDRKKRPEGFPIIVLAVFACGIAGVTVASATFAWSQYRKWRRRRRLQAAAAAAFLTNSEISSRSSQGA